MGSDLSSATNAQRAICVNCNKIIPPLMGVMRISYDGNTIVFSHRTQEECEDAEMPELEPGPWKHVPDFRGPEQALRDRLKALRKVHDGMVDQIDHAWQVKNVKRVVHMALDLSNIETEIKVMERILEGDWKWRK